ncbi:hypothetical protein KGY79_10995, partial [Candidatus Bipolaricaulota bacterium]|nr:hypothetical protein [Candidatus Bipolaricaulota bacterium]
MEKNITKFRLKTFLVFFSFLLVIAISLSMPAYADKEQTPSCTCPKGDTSSCPNDTTLPVTTTTIWIEGNPNNYTISGGPNDGESYNPGTDTIEGTTGNDLIIGSKKGDIIEGKGGNDIICGDPDKNTGEGSGGGGAGEDEIYGGSGHDYICGGNNDDELYGNEGDDIIEGNNGKDTIDGGPGNDCLYGNNAKDEIGGGSGDNYIDGGRGKDDCYEADDIINCEEGTTPNIKLEKKTGLQGDTGSFKEADDPPGPMIETGEIIEWKYEATNEGNVGVDNVTVVDNMGDDTTNDKEICNVNLDPGASTTCKYSDEYEAATAQIGQYSNEAEATYDYGGSTYSVTDPSHYFGIDFSVSQSVLEAEITQEDDLDQWNSGTVSSIQFKPTSGTYSHSFEVTFAYPDGYDVKVDYTVELGDASPSSLTNDPLILDSTSYNDSGGIDEYIPRAGEGTL